MPRPGVYRPAPRKASRALRISHSLSVLTAVATSNNIPVLIVGAKPIATSASSAHCMITAACAAAVPAVGRNPQKALCPSLGKSPDVLDDKLLPSTSHAVERGNQRYRKMQK